MSLSALPTAPRASMEVEIDYSKIPEQPPYTAFLGNLPYDVEKMDIMDFFSEVQVKGWQFTCKGYYRLPK
jgi:translation initiation factor 4B